MSIGGRWFRAVAMCCCFCFAGIGQSPHAISSILARYDNEVKMSRSFKGSRNDKKKKREEWEDRGKKLQGKK